VEIAPLASISTSSFDWQATSQGIVPVRASDFPTTAQRLNARNCFVGRPFLSAAPGSFIIPGIRRPQTAPTKFSHLSYSSGRSHPQPDSSTAARSELIWNGLPVSAGYVLSRHHVVSGIGFWPGGAQERRCRTFPRPLAWRKRSLRCRQSTVQFPPCFLAGIGRPALAHICGASCMGEDPNIGWVRLARLPP